MLKIIKLFIRKKDLQFFIQEIKVFDRKNIKKIKEIIYNLRSKNYLRTLILLMKVKLILMIQQKPKPLNYSTNLSLQMRILSI